MLTRADVARRIPHQGRMCLLERVVSWNADAIHCEAISHRAADNPLRAHGRLGVACGIEYAAQAMALHGALVAQAQGAASDAPRVGYLASVRGVELHVQRLDDVPGDLAVHVERMLGDTNNIVYQFRLEADGRALLAGRATVVLDASLVLQPATEGTQS